jgi:hypothetical protein
MPLGLFEIRFGSTSTSHLLLRTRVMSGGQPPPHAALPQELRLRHLVPALPQRAGPLQAAPLPASRQAPHADEQPKSKEWLGGPPCAETGAPRRRTAQV